MEISCSSAQMKFLKAKTRYTVFRGGIGAGKTRVLVYKAVLNALQGRKGLLLSNTFSQSRDVVLATFREVLPLFGLVEDIDYIINKSDMDVVVRGTYIHLRSCEQQEKLRGLNCSDLYIDEARNMATDEVFLIAIGRIREVEDAQCFISTSPRGRDWVWKLSQTEGVTTIVQKTIDNPFLPASYIEDLKNRYAGIFAQQELDAEIVEFGGGIIDISRFIKGNYVATRPTMAVDIAVSTKTSADYSAIVIASNTNGSLIIHDIWRDRVEYKDLKSNIIRMAEKYNVGQICIEDVAAQRIVIDDLKHVPELRKYSIHGKRPRGDKLARALPWISRIELNQVKVQNGIWNDMFFEECSQFNGIDQQHDDMIDGVSMVYDALYNQNTVIAKMIKF